MTRGIAYSNKGDKDVVVERTTGYKKRLTNVLGILSYGRNFPALVIGNSYKQKGQNRSFQKFNENVIYTTSKSAWIYAELLIKWSNQVLNKIINYLSQSYDLYLCLDHCSSHKKQRFS
jgi:hypothetical protein